jgi:hypothetical protein
VFGAIMTTMCVYQESRVRTGIYSCSQFKELNSLLNRQVAEYEASVKNGTHSLSVYSGPEYEPSLEAEVLKSGFTLGGSSSTVMDDTAEARRDRVLKATLARLARDEKEIEDMCGNGRTSHSANSGS